MAKDKAKPIRCLMDATDLPPSAFALPDDGRQQKHLCMARKSLCIALARHANADGSNCFPSKTTLGKSTGFSPRTIARLFNDLAALGFLSNGDVHPVFRTTMRTLTLPKGAVSSSEEGPCHLREGAVSSSQGAVSSSGVRVAGSPEDGPHTALDLPLIQPLSPRKSASENLGSYRQVAKWFRDEMEVMAGAQKKPGEKAQLEALIAEHGGARFLAALRHYCLRPGADADAKLGCKWTVFIENSELWFSKEPQPPLERQAEERWRQENPEEWQRQIDESIERQLREHIAKRDRPRISTKNHCSEISVDDLFKD
jgi:Helix-turn-helix domain